MFSARFFHQRDYSVDWIRNYEAAICIDYLFNEVASFVPVDSEAGQG